MLFCCLSTAKYTLKSNIVTFIFVLVTIILLYYIIHLKFLPYVSKESKNKSTNSANVSIENKDGLLKYYKAKGKLIR